MWSWISGGGKAVNLPVSVGEETGQCLSGRSVFKLHHATNKSDSQPVSVFKFENTPACTPEQKNVAKAEFKRLRVLRHPNVVKYIDGVDNENVIYIVTEAVTPLLSHIEAGTLNDNAICWGLYQIITGLKFIHQDCGTAHRNLYSSSIFVTKSGEWKIGGVAFCDDSSTLPLPSRVNQYLSKYDPPEVLRGVNTSPTTTDIWQLGVLIWEVFNGNMTSPQSLRDISRIPAKLTPMYRALVSNNYKSRPTVDKVFETLTEYEAYFSNSFVTANIFLNELTIKEPAEKQQFFAQLSNHLDDFPPEFCKYKILPALITTFQYGDVGIDVLPPLFKLGKLLSEQEYKSQIIPCVLKLFSSPDRAMRIQLLTQLDNFIQYLDKSVVDQQIFPAVCTGFTDTVPGMREHTIKSMLQLAPKLSESTIDNQLLKFLAKSQTDPEPPIRTNTTICISKISVHFSDATRRKVLIPAFLRALKDPFAHARNAGLLALCCTIQHYFEPDIANRILPSLCPLLIDHDKMVREQGMKAIKLFIEKIENHYKGITPAPTTQDTENKSKPANNDKTEPETAGWAKWAVSSMSTMTAKYMSNTSGNINSGSKEGVPKPTSQPDVTSSVRSNVQAKPDLPSNTPDKRVLASSSLPLHDDPDNGWDDGWDDIDPVPTISLPKTKSTMKLGDNKSNSTLDDDDLFISTVLNEEKSLLNQKKKTVPVRTESPKFVESAPSAPQNQAVKLTPWDTPSGGDVESKDLLSSYFSYNNADFFGEMGVGEKTESKKNVASEWDSFNLNPSNAADSNNEFNNPTSQQAPKPQFTQTSRPQFKQTSKIQFKQTSQSKVNDWDNDDDFDSWDSQQKKTMTGIKPLTKTATAKKQQNVSNDWGDWDDSVAQPSTRFQSVSKSEYPTSKPKSSDMGSLDKPSREERRRQQQERRNPRTRGGMGARKKD